MADNNDFTHEFQIYTTDLNAGTMGTGKFLLFDNNINALKVESIDNIKIGGGANGRLLATDGEGNLRWISAAAGTGGVSSYNELEDLPTLFSGDYNDLTNKPSIPTVPTTVSSFTNDAGYLTSVGTPTMISSGNTAPGSAVVANETNVSVNFSDGGSGKFVFKANGQLQLASGGDIVDSTGASVLGGSSGPTNEITNTEPSSPSITNPSTYSVSVGTDGVVTMVTARGNIEFGALPEVGGPNHLHIMRPASQEGATDLFFGDDYNYVKLPAAYGSGTQGVEIGSSYGQGTVGVWRFGTDGDLVLPAGGDIKDDNGNSLLFSGSYNDLSDTPSLFSGDYDDLNNKPTIRIAVATGSGPGGNLQADSLALAGLNPVTDIPSTWGGDLILQGGVGGANGDLYGEVRIKSGQIGANYEWHFTTDKKIKLPAGGDIVDSTGATVFVSLATLKQVVADSTDFADFKSRIANM